MDALVNGAPRGTEIVVSQELGRDIVISCQGKEILKCRGELLIAECLRVFGKNHKWALDKLEELGG